jgi:hypothetical protein
MLYTKEALNNNNWVKRVWIYLRERVSQPLELLSPERALLSCTLVPLMVTSDETLFVWVALFTVEMTLSGKVVF